MRIQRYIPILFWLILSAMALCLSAVSAAFAQNTTGGQSTDNSLLPYVIWTNVALVIFITMVGILLHRSFANRLQKDNAGEMLAEMPLGLPKGSVRAMLAFFIVINILTLFLISTVFNIPVQMDTLMIVLSTVLGFYFGGATAGKRADEMVRDQRDNAVAAQKQSVLAQNLGKAKEVLGMADLAVRFLPEAQRKTAEEYLKKAKGGVALLDTMTGKGQVGDALEKAQGIIKDLGQNPANPLVALLSNAKGAFAALGGLALSPAGLILGVAGVGTYLGAGAYNRWKASVLDEPYRQDLFPPHALEASEGKNLLLVSPIFKKAFAPEYQADDRPFFAGLMSQAFSETQSHVLYNSYMARFSCLEEFENGLAEYRSAGLQQELLKDFDSLPPEALKDVGGINALLQAVKAAHQDREARPSLQKLVLAALEIKDKGGNPYQVIQTALKDMEKMG